MTEQYENCIHIYAVKSLAVENDTVNNITPEDSIFQGMKHFIPFCIESKSIKLNTIYIYI